ncbi:MAG: hypothetical protein CM1200mP20_12550 [Pseudomonadota bacterium]|nr:MAG: hypothetical protein CM1200mP20_12550 [Pseudomonadota bacterium]
MYNPDNYQYVNLQFKGDLLVGANTVGYHQHLGVLRGLIESQVPLGPWKEGLMKNPVGLMEGLYRGDPERERNGLIVAGSR